MDLIKAMAVFKRVAESGSFSAVARETGLSQPTVSKHIAALEKHLGTQLLSRSTRQLSLTETGAEYYERCRRILDELDEARASVGRGQSLPTGTLRVNFPVTFGRMYILPALWSFLERNPELQIDAVMEDRYIDLVKEGVDLAIRIGPLTDSTLIARKIGDSPRLTVASPDYLAQHGEPELLSDLQQHSCIVYSFLTTRNEWHFTGSRGEESLRVQGRFSANSPDAIRASLLADCGIAVTPLWLVSDLLKENRLKVILTDYTPTPLDIHAIYPERRFVPQKVRLFIEHLRETMVLP